MNNTGQIVKAKGSVPYAQIPNELLRNNKLSMKAKGLMSFLLSLPENWVLYKTQLSDHFSDGYDGIHTAWTELENAGYIVSIRMIDHEGKLRGWNHVVYYSPGKIEEIDKTPIKTGIPTDSGISEIGFPEIGKSRATKKDSTNKENKKKEERSPIFSFLQFWGLYAQSNGEGKAQAQAEWNKLRAEDKNDAVNNLQWWLSEFEEKYSSYTNLPLAKTYLAGRRWEDEFNSY